MGQEELEGQERAGNLQVARAPKTEPFQMINKIGITLWGPGGVPQALEKILATFSAVISSGSQF